MSFFIFPSSSYSLNPIIASPIITLNYIVPFVTMNKSVEAFAGLDHQYTPEDFYIKLMHTSFFQWEKNLLILKLIINGTNEIWHIFYVSYLETL